jgi:pimeloyl-ACP methyl ester carboxylesterase
MRHVIVDARLKKVKKYCMVRTVTVHLVTYTRNSPYGTSSLSRDIFDLTMTAITRSTATASLLEPLALTSFTPVCAYATMTQHSVVVTKSVVNLLGWPTDVVSIDPLASSKVHTTLLFVPGNPGLVGWYIPALVSILEELGPGYAARGISYAGHGVTQDIVHVEAHESSPGEEQQRNVQIPWTVNGQIEHKLAWMDSILQEDSNNLIFLSHSIGAHMIQRMLVLRPDLLSQTVAIIHWMPFIRMDAPWQQQVQLDTVAHRPDMAISVGKRVLSCMSKSMAQMAFSKSIPDVEGRELAVNLISHATFVRNFLELGTEEIRDLPQLPDVRVLFFGCTI